MIIMRMKMKRQSKIRKILKILKRKMQMIIIITKMKRWKKNIMKIMAQIKKV